MLPRTLEPEVMDTACEAHDYDAMDHSHVNRVFVDDFLAAADSAGMGESLRRLDPPVSVLDLGSGTAQIPIELARRPVTCRVAALDYSWEMLRLARRNVVSVGLNRRIPILRADAKRLPCASGQFGFVVSNSIVHHIPHPPDVFAEMLRVLRPGGLLFVRDLLRPADARTVDHLVATYAGGENEHQRQLFRDSLHAALTLEEVRAILARFKLPTDWAAQTSDRHWTVSGVTRPGR
jgi:ubiquinone/menaquinone biosynthesis C-methylase UbiE